MAQRSLTLVLAADTHELHREIDMPSSPEIFIHAGDATMFSRSMASIADFNSWLGELPYTHRIYVPGNHESFLESRTLRRCFLLSNATVLVNESTTCAGLKLWGSPVSPLSNTAFGMPSDADRRRHYSGIPEDTDVLITHEPPFGILDIAPGSRYHAGCPELREAVQRVQPMLHVFGHIHGAGGSTEDLDGTLYVNACLMSQQGDLEQNPIVIRIQAAR